MTRTLILAIGFGAAAGCGLGAEPLEGTPISPDDLQRITLDTELIEMREMLASDGYSLQLEEGTAYQRDDAYAAVFPVESGAGGACEYESLIYQEAGDGILVFLELAEAGSASPSSPEETHNLACQGWSSWQPTGSSWCGTHLLCPFQGAQATYEEQVRSRWCCDAYGQCHSQWDYRSIKRNCGC